MTIYLNDLAFCFNVSNRYKAIDIMNQFAIVLHELKRIGALDKLTVEETDRLRGAFLTDDYLLVQYYNDSKVDMKCRRFLCTLITNSNRVKLNALPDFRLKEHSSRICARAYLESRLLVSPPLEACVSNSTLDGIMVDTTGEKSVIIRNIALLEHISIYKNLLQIRIYEFSNKHKVNYGWGSEMNLNDQEAQELLEKAIPVSDDGKWLVGKKDNKYYSFRAHHQNYYHGYLDERMPEKWKRRLDML